VLAVKMQPGDAVIFDNHRMLHARAAYSGGNRHLQGCYISRDDFRTCLNHPSVRDLNVDSLSVYSHLDERQ
jgi:hypothetical protein